MNANADMLNRITVSETLRDLLEWLQYAITNGPVETRGHSDESGHPHSYAVILVPDWQIKQKLANVQDAITAHDGTLEVLRACAALFDADHALDRFDWGKSLLRAQDIRELNELPMKIHATLEPMSGRERRKGKG